MGTTATSMSAKYGVWYLSPLPEPIRLWPDGAGAVVVSTDIEKVSAHLNFDLQSPKKGVVPITI